jgi:hypothetical protein
MMEEETMREKWEAERGTDGPGDHGADGPGDHGADGPGDHGAGEHDYGHGMGNPVKALIE